MYEAQKKQDEKVLGDLRKSFQQLHRVAQLRETRSLKNVCTIILL